MLHFRVVLCKVLLRGRSAVRLVLALLCDNGRAVASQRLHADRNSQSIAAEQRQPEGQRHGDKFSDGTKHVFSLAKFVNYVKRKMLRLIPALPLNLFTLRRSRYHACNFDNVMLPPHECIQGPSVQYAVRPELG